MAEEPLIACASIVASPAIGVCRTTDDLRVILRARFTELGISLETVDHIAGLPQRYTQTLLGLQPKKQFGPISFDALLGTAGIKLIAVADQEALDRVRSRLAPLQRVNCGAAARRRVIVKLTPQHMREIGSKGGRACHAIALRKKARSEIYRRNALKRWHRTEVAADQVTATA